MYCPIIRQAVAAHARFWVWTAIREPVKLVRSLKPSAMTCQREDIEPVTAPDVVSQATLAYNFVPTGITSITVPVQKGIRTLIVGMDANLPKKKGATTGILSITDPVRKAI